MYAIIPDEASAGMTVLGWLVMICYFGMLERKPTRQSSKPALGVRVSTHFFLHPLNGDDFAIDGQLRLLSRPFPLLDQIEGNLPFVAIDVFLHAPILQFSYVL